MKKFKNTFLVVLLCSLFLFSCTIKNKQRIDLFTYDGFDQFKNWSISERDKSIAVFTKTKSDSIINRFFVAKEKGEFLVMEVLPPTNQYVVYSKLSEEQKKIIDENLIKDYYGIGYDRINHKMIGNNSFLIIGNKTEIYWHFFNLDTLNPPVMISKFEQVDKDWYHIEVD